MLSGNVFRIYPTKDQAKGLNVQFGTARWVWSQVLDMRKRSYQEEKKHLSKSILQTWLKEAKQKEETAWLKGADSQVLQYVLWNQEMAFKHFFAKRARFPRFKSKKHHRIRSNTLSESK